MGQTDNTIALKLETCPIEYSTLTPILAKMDRGRDRLLGRICLLRPAEFNYITQQQYNLEQPDPASPSALIFLVSHPPMCFEVLQKKPLIVCLFSSSAAEFHVHTPQLLEGAPHVLQVFSLQDYPLSSL
jgi:hypothetical protein